MLSAQQWSLACGFLLKSIDSTTDRGWLTQASNRVSHTFFSPKGFMSFMYCLQTVKRHHIIIGKKFQKPFAHPHVLCNILNLQYMLHIRVDRNSLFHFCSRQDQLFWLRVGLQRVSYGHMWPGFSANTLWLVDQEKKSMLREDEEPNAIIHVSVTLGQRTVAVSKILQQDFILVCKTLKLG